jgi:hypothetical protein
VLQVVLQEHTQAEVLVEVVIQFSQQLHQQVVEVEQLIL